MNNYIPIIIIVVSIFNRDTPKQTVNVWEKKLGKPKTQKQSEENKINSIKKNYFIDRIIRDIRILFKQEDDGDYFIPKIVSTFLNNNYIECKINGNRNRNLSLDESVNKIKPYFRDIIINLQISDGCKSL